MISKKRTSCCNFTAPFKEKERPEPPFTLHTSGNQRAGATGSSCWPGVGRSTVRPVVSSAGAGARVAGAGAAVTAGGFAAVVGVRPLMAQRPTARRTATTMAPPMNGALLPAGGTCRGGFAPGGFRGGSVL